MAVTLAGCPERVTVAAVATGAAVAAAVGAAVGGASAATVADDFYAQWGWCDGTDARDDTVIDGEAMRPST